MALFHENYQEVPSSRMTVKPLTQDQVTELLADPGFKIYGWSVKDILNVQKFLQANHVRLDDLECCQIVQHGWCRETLLDSMMDFK